MDIVYIIFVLVCAIGFFWWYIKYMKKNEHYQELAKYYRIDNTDIDAIRKFFKENPDELYHAERRFREDAIHKKEVDERCKKHAIINRVFAYDYEDMLYQIYAPLAEENYYQRWCSYKEIPKDLLIKKIMEIRKVANDEAAHILEELIKRNIIVSNVFENGECSLSFFLQDYTGDHNTTFERWDIVSYLDLNLDKWIVAHGYEHKK